MLKNLSRIFGIAGSVLTMVPYVAFIVYLIVGGRGTGIDQIFIIIYAAPALFSSAGIIASFFIRKKPFTAGIIIAVSAGLNIIPLPSSFFLLELMIQVKAIAALLLVAAGIFALISYKRTPEEPQSDRSKRVTAVQALAAGIFSRTIAIICAALHTLLWAVFCIFALFSEVKYYLVILASPFTISALGLWGSLLLRKHPVPGALLMFVSGGLVYFIASSILHYWWILILPLLLIAASVFALISFFISRKASPDRT